MAHQADPWCFDLLERLAEAIVAVVGPHCEVVVHDFGDLEHSAVIVAGDITGREPGAPVPDLGFVADGLDRDAADQLNYRARIGEHYLQSSTVWIRDAGGNPTGAICINVDYSSLLTARDIINSLAASTQQVSDLVVSDTFARDSGELIRLSVHEVLSEQGLDTTAEMCYDAKLRLIEVLESRGLFQMRGAVNQVAEQLGVSRATVYNYRSNLRVSEE